MLSCILTTHINVLVGAIGQGMSAVNGQLLCKQLGHPSDEKSSLCVQRKTGSLVVIETFATLLPKPASIDVLPEQYSGSIFAVSKTSVQGFHDGEASVEANKVGQGQGAHGNIGSILHNAIDVFFCPDALFQADDGFVDVRHQNSVGQEARDVGGDGWDLAHLLAEVYSGFEGLGRGLETRDDLDAFLDGDGVHEVGGDDP